MSTLTLTQSEIRLLLKKHRGAFHGPHVEHLSIAEENFWEFMEEFGALVIKRHEWDHVKDEMGGDYVLRTLGARP